MATTMASIRGRRPEQNGTAISQLPTYALASSMSVPYVGTSARKAQQFPRIPHHKVVGLTPRPPTRLSHHKMMTTKPPRIRSAEAGGVVAFGHRQPCERARSDATASGPFARFSPCTLSNRCPFAGNRRLPPPSEVKGTTSRHGSAADRWT